jgi:hypothetical protein
LNTKIEEIHNLLSNINELNSRIKILSELQKADVEAVINSLQIAYDPDNHLLPTAWQCQEQPSRKNTFYMWENIGEGG